MNREDKQLLIKTLCAMLPYGVCAELPNHHLVKHIYSIKSIDMKSGWTTGVLECAGQEKLYSAEIEDIKPYLRPILSMTEEEKDELVKNHIKLVFKTNDDWSDVAVDINGFDWLNTNYFDYRGLIPKGLAVAVTKENNPYKS